MRTQSGHGSRIRDVFWQIFKDKEYSLPSLGGKCCFTFDMHAKDQYSVIYGDQDYLVLIAVREIVDNGFNLLDPHMVALQYKWNTPAIVNTAEVTSKALLATNPHTAGYLVQDSQLQLLCIESPLLRVLKGVDNTMDKQTQELLLLQLIVDYPFQTPTLCHYPFQSSFETYPFLLLSADEATFKRVISEFIGLCNYLDQSYSTIRHLKRAEFTVEAEKHGDLAAFLYFIRDGSFESTKQFFEQEGTTVLLSDLYSR